VALTVTQTIATRVRQLRLSRGMSAKGLAERMQEVGIPWKREIVANLEHGRRATVGVDELFALAVIFDVAPTALCVVVTEAEIGITPTEVMNPVDALLWIAGVQPRGSESGPWLESTAPNRIARDFATGRSGVEEFLYAPVHPNDSASLRERRRELAELNVEYSLTMMWSAVEKMAIMGMTVPEIAPALMREAERRNLGWVLPPNVAHYFEEVSEVTDRG
jgi:transcriptional regulator with XRE-family HTH domain